MTESRDLALPASCTDLLGELKNRVRAARTAALRTVNTQLIEPVGGELDFLDAHCSEDDLQAFLDGRLSGDAEKITAGDGGEGPVTDGEASP